MMRMLLAALLLLPPAQSEADKLEAALKKFGNRTYGMYVSGKKAGLLKLKTKIETEGGRRLAIFEDSMTEPATGGTVTGIVTEKASLDGLRLSTLRWVSILDGRRSIDSVTVEGSKAVVIREGEKKTLTVPEKTMGESGLLRQICAVEQKKGEILNVEILNHVMQELESRELKCDGEVDIEIAGKKQVAFRWREQLQEGKSGANVRNTYWVSAAGHLLKYIGLGGVEYVLESK
ncbi:MAG TPA: hypothetical protein VJU16_08795 [Planctomycetota bacterium]|nr:hypothetical protein [Planctomycetota bacterium]